MMDVKRGNVGDVRVNIRGKDNSHIHSWDRLSPTKSKRRCGGHSVQCRSVSDPLHHRVVSVYCHTWDCDRCRPKLISEWIDGMRDNIMGVEHLYLSIVPSADWHNYSAKLRRHYAQYVRVRVGSMYWVLNTYEGEELVSDARMGAFEMLLLACTGRKPVSTSRGWGRSQSVVDPVPTSEWQRVQELPYDVEVAEQVARYNHNALVATWHGGFDIVFPSLEASVILTEEMRLAFREVRSFAGCQQR